MAEKLRDYQGALGRFHEVRDDIKEIWGNYKCSSFWDYIKSAFVASPECDDYSHVYRRKSRGELIRISAAVMGIEFSYAAETAFVSPTLLKIGVEHKHMTLVWALSPLIGFFLTPILGSLSDRCSLKMGRRRPFIIIMSLGVLLGLILVPNGEDIGYSLGDTHPANSTSTTTPITSAHRTSGRTTDFPSNINSSINEILNYIPPPANSHPWGIFFTILGTVLLDFDADACQSPARTYLLDVTLEDDHAKGLSTFTIMAGLGGFFGYALGGINWDVTTIGIMLGGHVRAVFTLITVIFIICVAFTITSFKEIPLQLLESGDMKNDINLETVKEYGALNDEIAETGIYSEIGEVPVVKRMNKQASLTAHPDASLITYLQSIVYMPASLRILCLTNLFCWMAHVCYSLYFTDFVGEAVFNGSPTAFDGSIERQLYEDGVRFGCWGMSMYSLSCACYSSIIEKLIKRFGAKKVYVGGLLIYSIGMLLMALTKHKVGVILFSWTAGVMYSTLFTMPYLLVAHYHSRGTFAISKEGEGIVAGQIRGLGTDIALVSSMVFLAQFILSMWMGTIVATSGTTTAVVSVASALAFCGAITATQVMYLDL